MPQALTGPTGVEKHSRAIIEKLAELGGGSYGDDSIVHEGTRIVLPLGLTESDAIRVLKDHIKAEEEVTSFSRIYRFRPWDGGHAFASVIKKHFGFAVGKPIKSFFGDIPPSMRTINVSHDQTEQIPWGDLALPFMPGATVSLQGTLDREWGSLFAVKVEAPRKYRHAIEGMFRLVQEELETNSLYRGKAIDGAEMANFLDIAPSLRENVIYTDEVIRQLGANVWSLLRHTESQRTNNLPLKRSILLEGPYGTGKTLAAYLTALEAVENGWTFLYCRPAQDDIASVMQTARLYQPAVVFFEDVDVISDSTENGSDAVSKLLDVFDGLTAKNTEIMVVLTTNHPENIHKGMLRPGRLDAIVSIGHLDATGIERMVRHLVRDDLLDPNVNYEAVYQAMSGYLPAFIKESIDRAKRYNIARNNGTLTLISTDDLVDAANGLRPQFDMMTGANDAKPTRTLEQIYGEVALTATREALSE